MRADKFIYLFSIMLTRKVYIEGATKSFLVHDPFKIYISLPHFHLRAD